LTIFFDLGLDPFDDLLPEAARAIGSCNHHQGEKSMLGVPALLKLSASLPDIFRSEGARTQKQVHLDSSVWFHQ
jgi:hypothetical protein